MTYGNFSGSVLEELAKLPKASEFKFHYVNEILMIDNYLPGFDINKELKNEPKKQIDKNISLIVNDIRCRKINSIAKKGFFARLLHKITSKFFVINGKNDSGFRVDKSCINCGICQSVCPKRNISVCHGKVSFHHNCDFCMACINACKINAIHIRGEKNSKRFRNRSISLQEIIDANDQNKHSTQSSPEPINPSEREAI
jgi:ferredoxin